MQKVLTPELVLARAKTDKLFSIRNLNVWGNDLSDISIIQKLSNVEVLSLSVNKISSLKDLSNCLKLQELYLRKNSIMDLSELRYLINLPELKVLWLSENPCTEVSNYREKVISLLPKLTKLDNQPVTPEDKANAKRLGMSIDDILGPSQEKEEPDQFEYAKPQKKQGYYDSAEPEDDVYEERGGKGYQPDPPQPQYKNAGGGGYKKYRDNDPQPEYNPRPSRELPNERENKYDSPQSQQQGNNSRNDNIVCAIMTLIKELDGTSLELLKSSVEKRLSTLNLKSLAPNS